MEAARKRSEELPHKPLSSLYQASIKPLSSLYQTSVTPMLSLYQASFKPLLSLYQASIKPLSSLYQASIKPRSSLYEGYIAAMRCSEEERRGARRRERERCLRVAFSCHHLSSHRYICVRIRLCVCPTTALCVWAQAVEAFVTTSCMCGVRRLLHVCPNTTV